MILDINGLPHNSKYRDVKEFIKRNTKQKFELNLFDLKSSGDGLMQCSISVPSISAMNEIMSLNSLCLNKMPIRISASLTQMPHQTSQFNSRQGQPNTYNIQNIANHPEKSLVNIEIQPNVSSGNVKSQQHANITPWSKQNPNYQNQLLNFNNAKKTLLPTPQNSYQENSHIRERKTGIQSRNDEVLSVRFEGDNDFSVQHMNKHFGTPRNGDPGFSGGFRKEGTPDNNTRPYWDMRKNTDNQNKNKRHIIQDDGAKKYNPYEIEDEKSLGDWDSDRHTEHSDKYKPDQWSKAQNHKTESWKDTSDVWLKKDNHRKAGHENVEEEHFYDSNKRRFERSRSHSKSPFHRDRSSSRERYERISPYEPKWEYESKESPKRTQPRPVWSSREDSPQPKRFRESDKFESRHEYHDLEKHYDVQENVTYDKYRYKTSDRFDDQQSRTSSKPKWDTQKQSEYVRESFRDERKYNKSSRYDDDKVYVDDNERVHSYDVSERKHKEDENSFYKQSYQRKDDPDVDYESKFESAGHSRNYPTYSKNTNFNDNSSAVWKSHKYKKYSPEKDNEREDNGKDIENFSVPSNRDRISTVHKYSDSGSDKRHHEKQYKGENTVSDPNESKRKKASNEIASILMNKHSTKIPAGLENKICEKLSLKIYRFIDNYYGDQDVSYIEMCIKFNAKYESLGEEFLEGIIKEFSASNVKTQAVEFSPMVAPVAATSRDNVYKIQQEPSHLSSASSTALGMTNYINQQGFTSQLKNPVAVADWNLNPVAAQPMNVMYLPPNFTQMPAGNVASFSQFPQMLPAAQVLPAPMLRTDQPATPTNSAKDNFYLCKDNFEPFTEDQAAGLREYLISKMASESTVSQSWAPNFTFKGLQSKVRYELETSDPASKVWILNLNFDDFKRFNVIVYTKEELWYERAAIWLPGHIRSHKNINPLTIIKLQNKHLENVNVHLWKLVKSIVTFKGVRIYVDMPPSSARALEKYKMMLSYELQKVHVFLKAAAIDKNAFDVGMRESSISKLRNETIDNSPMPTLSNKEANLVRVTIEKKPVNLQQANRLRLIIVMNIVKYLQEGGSGKIDFLKYGLCSPGFFGVVPGNEETKQWMLTTHFGSINGKQIFVIGGVDKTPDFITATILIDSATVNFNRVLEDFRLSNADINLDVSAWKLERRNSTNSGASRFEVRMDLDSAQSIYKNGGYLKYNDGEPLNVTFKNVKQLLEYIKQSEDVYEVTNMDVDSSSE